MVKKSDIDFLSQASKIFLPGLRLLDRLEKNTVTMTIMHRLREYKPNF